MKTTKDYEKLGMSIQKAKVDQFKDYPDKELRPDFIVWGDHKIRTAYRVSVPERFRVILEFISKPDSRQGVDIKVGGGALILKKGEEVQVLRTWHDAKYEPIVEYSGYSKDNEILIYNVYKEKRGSRVFEERWTRNAGFWLEELTNCSYIFHCSPSWESPPNFDSLIFKVTISSSSRSE